MSAAITVRVSAHPAELTRDGGVVVSCCSPDSRREVVTVSAVSELAAVAARVAADYGKPCAVWIGLATRGRKPRGFDAETSRISRAYWPGAIGGAQ